MQCPCIRVGPLAVLASAAFKSIPDTVCGFYQRFVFMDMGDCTLTFTYMYVCLEKNMCI